MIVELDNLIAKSEDDPLELLELTAKFLDFSASSKADLVEHYNQKLNKVYEQHNEVPFVKPLKYLTDGTASFYLTQYGKANTSLGKAEESFKVGMPKDIMGAIKWAKGITARSLGEVDKAVKNHWEAIEYLNPNSHFLLTYAYSHYQLGELHVAIKEYPEAKQYYENALEGIKDSDDITANFRINNGLGNCYLILKDYDKAGEYLSKAMSIPNLSPAERGRGLCDLGVLSIHQDDFNKAEEYLLESLEIRDKYTLEDAASTTKIHLGTVYNNQNRIPEAISILEKGLEVTKQYNALGKQILALKRLSDAYNLAGDKENSLKYLVEYDKINTEIRNNQERKIFRLKNKQIQEQKQEVLEKNIELKDTLDELAKVKNSRKSLIFSISTAIVLVILTEVFLDPIIESYSYNNYISLGVKVLIALMLKPMESLYERLLFRRAMKLK